MRIGEVAERAGVPIKTIRYYEEIGVLASARRLPSGYRDFEPEVVERLRFVRASQALGLTLGEIREIVAYRDHGDAPCAYVLELLRHRRDQCAARIAELRLAEQALDALVERSAHLRPEDCPATGVCHLISREA